MAVTAPLALVTGANRGIGLALCKRLKDEGFSVVAACRKPSDELQALGVTAIVDGVEVGQDGGCVPLAAALAAQNVGRIDLLVCNAGVAVSDSLAGMAEAGLDGLRTQFEVNSLGPLRTYLAVKDLLAEGCKVAIISSVMGSIADSFKGSEYGYRMSKAAVNMLGMNLAVDLRSKGVAVGIIHPGLVKTDMSKKYHGMPGMIGVEESADGLVKVLTQKLSMDTSGTFFTYDGSVLPW